MKRSIILTSRNLGDGLIFAVLAHNLAKSGREVTLLSPLLGDLAGWLPGFAVRNIPLLDDLLEVFRSCDEIYIEMHNLPIIDQIYALREKFGSKLQFLCPIGSGMPLQKWDYVFDRNRCMVDNILDFVATLGIIPENSTGLIPHEKLKHRLNSKQVAIHSLSANASKNYPQRKFITIAHQLKFLGYEPIFLAHKNEKCSIEDPFRVFTFTNANELASFMYECGYFIGNDSGPGHLASALAIPGIILTKSERNNRLWRPGWFQKWKSYFRLNGFPISEDLDCVIKSGIH